MKKILARLALLGFATGLATSGAAALTLTEATPAQAVSYTNCFPSSQYYAPAGRVVLGTYCKRWPTNFYERTYMVPGEWVWIKAGNRG